jgi:hypothetical protein
VPLLQFYDFASQKQPWSGQRHLEKPFTPTRAELACLHSTNLTLAASPHGHNNDSIPNVAHFLYLFREPLALDHGVQFDFLSYLSVRSALLSLAPTAVYLHFAFLSPSGNSVKSKMHPVTNPWIMRLHNDIQVVEHNVENPMNQPIHHIADRVRLEILRDNGGIFLDTDAFVLKPFTSILNPPRPHDAVMGYEGGNRWGLRNAVFAARKDSAFIRDWVDLYAHGNSWYRQSHNSVLMAKKLASKKSDQLCALSPTAFFWPTWSWNHVDWMHQRLNPAEAAHWKTEIERHGGALFDGQLAYHAWSQKAWTRYLGKLTPWVVRNIDTRFNLLVRRFIENDLG